MVGASLLTDYTKAKMSLGGTCVIAQPVAQTALNVLL
jgi:hypothetical protein